MAYYEVDHPNAHDWTLKSGNRVTLNNLRYENPKSVKL
jgi:hypothetical protein